MAKQQGEKHFFSWKNAKFASMAWLMVILVLVIAVILNMIVARLDLSWDISANKQFSLDPTTEDYLDELDAQGITVDFYLLAEMDDLENDMDSLVLYRALLAYDAHDCINLIDFDPNTDTETLDQLNPDDNYSLSTGDMVFVCRDSERRLPGSYMYVSYLDDEGNTTSEEFAGENYITGSIRGVVEGYSPTVYFLTGHGERDIADYSTFTGNLINYNYQADTLDLSRVDAVPDDAALVLVCSPETDITDAEKEVLDAYLDGGGNITLLMSPNNSAIVYTNLEDVMADYGITMHYDRVRETESNYHVEGDDTTILCELTELSSDSSAADLTSALINQGLYTYMPASRSFQFYNEGGRYTIASLITTYDTAVGEAYGGNSDDPESFEDQNLVLACYSTSQGREDSKMAVFGNAEFLDDDHVSQEYFIVPLYLMLSTVTWMEGSDIDMDIDAVTSENDYIALQDESFATGLIVVLTVVPVVILAFGVIVWIKRRNS